MVTSFTACGNDSDKEKGCDGNKTITFWSVFTGGDGTAMQKIIDAYNATNPEYTVEHIMTEQGELYTKLPLVVNSQSGVPDLCIQHVDRLPSNSKAWNDYLWPSIVMNSVDKLTITPGMQRIKSSFNTMHGHAIAGGREGIRSHLKTGKQL